MKKLDPKIWKAVDGNPHIITIDGIDGIGKSTIAQGLVTKFEEIGIRVGHYEIPFYDTNTGKELSEILSQGYGNIRDRRVVSAVFATNRNCMYRHTLKQMLRDNDVVIFGRSWLTCSLFNTTLSMGDKDDAEAFKHAIVNMDSIDQASLNIDIDLYFEEATDVVTGLPYFKRIPNRKCYHFGSLADIRNFINKWYRSCSYVSTSVNKLADWYNDVRAKMVADHMVFSYDLEVAPWRIGYEKTPSTVTDLDITKLIKKHDKFVFTNAAPSLTNLVISPAPNTEGDWQRIIKSNLIKRAGGEDKLVDKAEKNIESLEDVVENIRWIEKHMRRILYFVPKAKRKSIRKAFTFITTFFTENDDSSSDSNDGVVVRQLNRDEMLDHVIDTLQRIRTTDA